MMMPTDEYVSSNLLYWPPGYCIFDSANPWQLWSLQKSRYVEYSEF
jgi:hypothetical protein